MILAALLLAEGAHAQSNHAIRFDGNDAWLDLGSRSSFNFRACFTLEAWVRPEAFGDTVGIIGNYRRDILGGSGQALVLAPDGRVGMIVAHDIRETDYAWSSQPVALDAWTHVAGSWDGRRMRLFVDGEEVGSTVVGGVGVLWTIENSMAIGRYLANESGYFQGMIDEVRIWDVCRSAVELRNTQHLRLKPGTAGQVSCLRFDEGGGTTTVDDVMADRVATLRGSSAWTDSDVCVGIGRTAQTSPSEPMRVHYFSGTDVHVAYTWATRGRPLTITSILDQQINDLPAGVARAAQRAWIIRPGADTFSVDMTFHLGRGALGAQDAAMIENLQLHYQPAGSRQWIRAGRARAADAATGAVTFGPIVAGADGIAPDGGRFVIGTSGDSRFDAPHALAIVEDLTDLRLCKNESVRLAPIVDGRNLLYTWRKDGSSIMSAVGAELAITLAAIEDDGVYELSVTDQDGATVTTRPSRLHVVVPPRILADPTDLHLIEGQTLELFTELDGTDIEYQWQFNRADIAGATSHVLVITNVDTNDAGYYRLMVHNDCGEDVSVDVRVRVSTKPVPMGVDVADAEGAITVQAWPNPAQSRLSVVARIGGGAVSDASIELVDARGVVVARTDAVQTSVDDVIKASFDLEAIAPGALLCRVVGDGRVRASCMTTVVQ